MTSYSLNIMQFNIEYGGAGVDFRSVGKAIRAAEADVVAIQEGCGMMAQIAADLGWPFYDARTQVVSKYPLLNPSSTIGGAILVEIAPRKVLAIINVHPPSRGYGPTLLVKGADSARVIRRERKIRVNALQPSVDAAIELISKMIPVVLLGDFNTPSHRDWTEESVGLREHVICPVEWPTSVAVEEAGLADVYRLVYPDPVTHPGLTWPADRPFVKGYNPARAGKAADRIDLMYASDAVRPVSVRLVGEVGSDMTDVGVDPWPTDHRAIVASLDVEPGAAPTLVSVARRLVAAGEDVEVHYNAVDDNAGQLAAVPAGSAPQGALLVERLLDARTGSRTLVGGQLESRAYDVLLLTAAGRELARTPLWVVEPGTRPGIRTGKPIYQVGEAVELSWENAPGNRADWVGVYPRGADSKVVRRLLWTYTGATVVGAATLDGGVSPRRWPLPAGEYTTHLMRDDQPISLAESEFTVLAS